MTTIKKTEFARPLGPEDATRLAACLGLEAEGPVRAYQLTGCGAEWRGRAEVCLGQMLTRANVDIGHLAGLGEFGVIQLGVSADYGKPRTRERRPIAISASPPLTLALERQPEFGKLDLMARMVEIGHIKGPVLLGMVLEAEEPGACSQVAVPLDTGSTGWERYGVAGMTIAMACRGLPPGLAIECRAGDQLMTGFAVLRGSGDEQTMFISPIYGVEREGLQKIAVGASCVSLVHVPSI